MYEQFLAAAAAHARRPAVIADGNPITYAELAEQAAAVAERLGPAPGVVAVPATHTASTIAALLGVWASGGTYCPMDPLFPAERQAAMARSVGCRTAAPADPSPAPAGPSAGRVSPAEGTGRAPAAADSGDRIAYTLFTSGSTGEPKPVETSHGALAAAVRSLRSLFEITPADRVLQFASLNWDTCFEEILPALTGGASIVFHRDAYSGSFPRFLRMVEREKVTVLDLPTAFWNELVGHLTDANAALPGCVRLVVIGGEAASARRAADWAALPTGHARLLNTYGCTETTLVTHAIDLHGPRGPWPGVGRVPIGFALPHVVEHITGDGELLIGGPALAGGYRGRPDATAERFVTIGGRRFFRTGDRVSRRPDGALDHEGRIDHEVKIRGIRVDPAEVEAHIAGHPEVRAVLVAGIEAAGRTALAAYVVPRPGAAGAGLGAGIVAHLRSRVPAHLIPAHIHVVADLAYTATGKVDRRRSKELLP